MRAAKGEGSIRFVANKPPPLPHPEIGIAPNKVSGFVLRFIPRLMTLFHPGRLCFHFVQAGKTIFQGIAPPMECRAAGALPAWVHSKGVPSRLVIGSAAGGSWQP